MNAVQEARRGAFDRLVGQVLGRSAGVGRRAEGRRSAGPDARPQRLVDGLARFQRIPVDADHVQEPVAVRVRRQQRRQDRCPRRHQRPAGSTRRGGSTSAATPSSNGARGSPPRRSRRSTASVRSGACRAATPRLTRMRSPRDHIVVGKVLPSRAVWGAVRIEDTPPFQHAPRLGHCR